MCAAQVMRVTYRYYFILIQALSYVGPELAQPYTCHIAALMADSHDPARHAAFRAVARLRLGVRPLTYF